MRHMPKGARLLCAQVVTGLIEEVTKSNSEFEWQKLFLFPHNVLRAHRKTDGVENGTKWVKDKLNSYVNNPNILPQPHCQLTQKIKVDSESDIAKKVEA